MAGERTEPGLDRVHALDDDGKVAALDDLLDQSQLFRRECGIIVPHGDGRSDIGLTNMVGA